jgi:hypothetical protein
MATREERRVYEHRYRQSAKGKAKRVDWARRNRLRLNERIRREDRHYTNRYGITQDDYRQMFADQCGACAICLEPAQGRKLCVDHCHTTGKIRGLLCRKCNSGIGMLRDSSVIVRLAANYLDG